MYDRGKSPPLVLFHKLHVPNPPVSFQASLSVRRTFIVNPSVILKPSKVKWLIPSPVVLLGVGPMVWEVYCSAVTSPLRDIFLGVDIQRGIGRRACGSHILHDVKGKGIGDGDGGM